ncbi:MAG: ATP-binding protein [Magnetococcales bacterium]|nr:ATP-binding protein [Magnetococcales bacterium]
MLVEFSVTNYLSFCETQILGLTAGSTLDEYPENAFDAGVARMPPLLKSMVVYGANASGKSNLIRAIKFVQEFVLNSAKGQEGDPIPITPFRLSARSANAPSVFELTFVQNGVRYQYGFAATRERVQHEWLLAYPKGRAQRWFERYFDPMSGEEEWHLHRSFLSSARNTWRDMTRSNALFLSTAVQLNSEELRPVFDWFAKKLYVLPPHSDISMDFTTHQVKKPEQREKVMAFLNHADLNIQNILVNRRTADGADGSESGGDPNYLNTLHALLKKKLEDWEWEIIDIQFERTTHDTGEPIALPWNTESQGTQKLFALAGPWIDMMENDRILFIDEMDTSLHHNLVQFLFGLVHAQEGISRSQLICTTHDTALLSSDGFRRDQYWMAQKNDHRCTTLYPVTRFNVGKSVPLQKRYLAGDYGAIPTIRRFGDL